MKDLQRSIDNTLNHLRTDLQSIRSGRANPALVERIPIPAYGSTLALVELATITTPEPRQILIQPWNQATVKDIERGINSAGLNFQAVVDGDRLRINLPPITEERRKEYLKLAGEKAEQARITIRRLRDEALRKLRDEERNGTVSEDTAEHGRDEIEKRIKEAGEDIQRQFKEKETELMTV